MLPQQEDYTPLAKAGYDLRQRNLLATEIQSKEFGQVLLKNLGVDIGILFVNYISRGKQHLSVFDPKFIVVDIYIYEQLAISLAIEKI